MNSSLGTTQVDEVMVSNLVTMVATEKIERAARILDAEDIHAAPVVDANGRCLGIFTSHDVVEYETRRIEVSQEIQHGVVFDRAHYGDGSEQPASGWHYDEVGFHMTRTIQHASPDDSLAQVAATMCREHVHHVVVLNDDDRPVGLLSTLDLLGFLMGMPVSRQRASRGSRSGAGEPSPDEQEGR